MLVSVVIPTLNRPKLLLRAIDSVLRQTYHEIEVIVVVDRPDPETVSAVRAVKDPRLQLIVNPHPSTAAGARNAGADHARGEWIAFLDDDDEWLPNKLERQITFACGRPPALLSCLSRVVTPTATYIWPQVIFNNSDPIDEYLFDRRSPLGACGFIQTSSYLLPRQLFDKVRFNVESRHDDWEFVLRLSKQAGASIETVPEVLVVLYFEEKRPTYTTRTSSWSASLRWLEGVRPMLTSRAYSGFCLGVVGSRAAQEGAYKAFPELLRRAFGNGSPGLWQVLPFLTYWITPQGFRGLLRGMLRGRLRPRSARTGRLCWRRSRKSSVSLKRRCTFRKSSKKGQSIGRRPQERPGMGL
jgi:glycosyltransferase involved in cell wall biosynthesis